jgi:hypothetical protein
LGIGDWGLGPIPNPQSPIPIELYNMLFELKNVIIIVVNLENIY